MTTTDWVSLLAGAVGAPESLALRVNWAVAESSLGVALPGDYKRLVEYFGSGEFDGYVGLLVPFAQNPLLDIAQRLSDITEILEEKPKYRERYAPYQVFPRPGGMLSWAYCGYGQRFYWLSERDDPDEWPVIAWEDGGRANYRFEGSTSEFLFRLLTEDLDIDFIPEREIEGPLTFVP